MLALRTMQCALLTLKQHISSTRSKFKQCNTKLFYAENITSNPHQAREHGYWTVRLVIYIMFMTKMISTLVQLIIQLMLTILLLTRQAPSSLRRRSSTPSWSGRNFSPAGSRLVMIIVVFMAVPGVIIVIVFFEESLQVLQTHSVVF